MKGVEVYIFPQPCSLFKLQHHVYLDIFLECVKLTPSPSLPLLSKMIPEPTIRLLISIFGLLFFTVGVCCTSTGNVDTVGAGRFCPTCFFAESFMYGFAVLIASFTAVSAAFCVAVFCNLLSYD